MRRFGRSTRQLARNLEDGRVTMETLIENAPIHLSGRVLRELLREVAFRALPKCVPRTDTPPMTPTVSSGGGGGAERTEAGDSAPAEPARAGPRTRVKRVHSSEKKSTGMHTPPGLDDITEEHHTAWGSVEMLLREASRVLSQEEQMYGLPSTWQLGVMSPATSPKGKGCATPVNTTTMPTITSGSAMQTTTAARAAATSATTRFTATAGIMGRGNGKASAALPSLVAPDAARLELASYTAASASNHEHHLAAVMGYVGLYYQEAQAAALESAEGMVTRILQTTSTVSTLCKGTPPISAASLAPFALAPMQQQRRVVSLTAATIKSVGTSAKLNGGLESKLADGEDQVNSDNDTAEHSSIGNSSIGNVDSSDEALVLEEPEETSSSSSCHHGHTTYHHVIDHTHTRTHTHGLAVTLGQNHSHASANTTRHHVTNHVNHYTPTEHHGRKTLTGTTASVYMATNTTTKLPSNSSLVTAAPAPMSLLAVANACTVSNAPSRKDSASKTPPFSGGGVYTHTTNGTDRELGATPKSLMLHTHNTRKRTHGGGTQSYGHDEQAERRNKRRFVGSPLNSHMATDKGPVGTTALTTALTASAADAVLPSASAAVVSSSSVSSTTAVCSTAGQLTTRVYYFTETSRSQVSIIGADPTCCCH